MNIPANPSLAYLAVALLFFGLVLLVFSFEIIKIETISVSKGKKTWIVAIAFIICGLVIGIPNISSSTESENKIEVTNKSNTKINVYPDINKEKRVSPLIKESIHTINYETGEREWQFRMLNGKRNGIAKQFYKNGQTKSIYTYKNGVLDGIYKKYNKEGKLIKSGKYE